MLAATVALLFPLIAEGAADVHKCRDAKGVIVYTDRPCAKLPAGRCCRKAR